MQGRLADRLRNALVLGVAIPLVLGAVHLLYPAACWIVLALLVVIAHRRPSTARLPRARDDRSDAGVLIVVAAVALVAWPALMRPPLDGDTLSYHLPNAAAWVHAHSLWSTDGRYWWYPPASELFASGVFATSGPAALPWCGCAALLLLAFRMLQWLRERFALPPVLAGSLVAAFVTAAPVALQAGTLQNDVWLAAFFLETYWCARANRYGAAMLAAGLTALLKPYGLGFAFLAALGARAPLRVWLAACAAAALWVAHDAVLWRASIVPPASTSYGNGFDSTIVAHGLPALALLAAVALRVSPFFFAALLAALAGPAIARKEPGDKLGSAIGWMALAALLFYLVMPLAYSGPGPQLATGQSLRYAIPAAALGTLALAPLALRAPLVSTLVAAAFAAYGAVTQVALFWNDAPTISAIGVALVAAAVVALASRRSASWPIFAGIAVAIVAASLLASRQPAAYYTDASPVNGRKLGLYAWIARTQPAAVGGVGLRLGTVNVLDPGARTVDLPDDATCDAARRAGVALVAVAENDRTAAFNLHRLQDAARCGRVLFDEGSAVVSDAR